MMLYWLLILGGLAHFALVPVSLAMPRLLDWDRELAKLRPFMQRLVWTYGGFIVLANVGFGAITLVGARDIVAGRPVGVAFAAFVALYWTARLAVQYGYFDWSDFPQSPLHRTARLLLDLLFLYLVLVYGFAAGRALLGA
jgi:hypothetical protein